VDILKNIEIAKVAARLAGKNLKDNYNSLNVTQLEEGRDIKLKADLESEKLIIEYISSKSDYPILGEETGKSTHDLEDIFWVVDPLDGTANYNRGIPICAVSIALVENNNPVIGVIYDFNADELYEGSVSSKAMMNDKPIFVSDIKDKSRGTLVTGLPVAMNYDEKNMQTLINNFQAWKKVRMIGSAAIASIYVASGKAELYTESGTNLWDVAAGVVICRAAGGNAVISNLSNDFSLDIKISNNLI
jgi:myo-inositol-1(or 4)-monophosphatase